MLEMKLKFNSKVHLTSVNKLYQYFHVEFHIFEAQGLYLSFGTN